MPDISLLQKTLTAGETVGLDTLDPRFQEIASLAEQAEYKAAAEKTEELIREDIYDIRLLGYFLFGCFLQSGLKGLPEIMEAAGGFFGESWSAIGPAKKKENHAQNGLAWMFTRLIEKLKYEEERKGEDWNSWTTNVTADDADAALAKIETFKAALDPVIPGAAKITDHLPKLQDWVRQFQKIVYVAPPPEPVAAPEPAPAADSAASAPPAAGSAPAAMGASAALAGVPAGFTVESSFRLQELVARMAAFDRLIEKEDYPKAALVANHVMELIEKFDPRKFFPRVFSPFYARLAPTIEQIQPWWDLKGSLPWQTMEHLCRMDVDAFNALPEGTMQNLLGSMAGGGGGGASPEPTPDAPPPDGSGEPQPEMPSEEMASSY